MPSTPRLYAGPSDNPRNGSASTSLSYPTKETTRAGPSMLGKEISPFNGAGIRFDGALGADIHTEAKLRAAREVNGQAPSTSQIPVGPRNGVKEESIEGNNLKEAIRSFSPCFKTGRTRAWEKSRRIEESDWMLSRQELDEQLRPEDEGLVPLNAIAGRMVLYGWQLFANQVEINASLSPLMRRKRIYDDAHEARKQLIKLLVLVQWSKVAPELQTARSLIAFINDHFVQTDAAVNALAETRSILTNARLRSYDLVTAIEALGTGGPQWIPPILKDVVQTQKPYTDAETIRLVTELEEAIRLRLACEEILPTSMTSYTISDGRARFRIPMLFEADLTLSGSSKEDRWWLLRVKFDFKVTGEGLDRFPRQPKKQQRINLLALADAELAPRSVAALVEQDAGREADETEANPDERDVPAGDDVEMGDASMALGLVEQEAAKRKDAPLVRLYNLIQSQALQYWLDILHFQATQQIKLGWGRRLSVHMESMQRSRALHILYWQRSDAEAHADQDGWRPTASGKMIISVREKPKEAFFDKVLKQLSTPIHEEISEHSRGQMVERLEMHVEWDVQGPAAEYITNRKITIDPQDLNVRDLLLEVTRRHLEASIKVIKAKLASSSLARLVGIHESSRSTERGSTEHLLHLTLGEKVTVALRVDQTPGQIRLEESLAGSSTTLANHDWLNHLRETSTKINEKPEQIVTILQGLRSKVILEDLQEKSLLLGISVTTRMPLRQVDYAQLRARPGTLLYISLKQCPSYYLVIHIGEESIRVALMCTGTFLEDLITSVRIVSLEWLDWQRVISSSARKESHLGKRKRDEHLPARTFTREELSKLYSYSVALICYHKVEQQLRALNLSFIHVGGGTSLRRPPSSIETSADQQDILDDMVPSLCLKASEILKSSSAETTDRNLSIHLRQWWDPSKASVVFSVRLKLKLALVTKETILESNQGRIQYNAQNGVISFSFRDIDNCSALFLRDWRHIDRILDLSRQLTLDEHKDFFSFVDCDLSKVRFTYSTDNMAEVRWVQDASTHKGGFYSLTFESKDASDGKENPHQVMNAMLTQWLNSQNDASTSFWTKFLQILRRTLSLLEQVYKFPEQCLESVECPELDIQTVHQFRLIFLNRFELHVRLTRGDKVLFSDGASINGASNSTQTINDEFSLDDDSPLPPTKTTAASSNAISSLRAILNDLLSQYRQHQEEQDIDKEEIDDQKQNKPAVSKATPPSSVLVFSNGLLCPNEALVIDWFLPRLIKRIQEAIE